MAEFIFEGVVTTNMLCVPGKSAAELQNFLPVDGPDDTWRQGMERMAGLEKEK